MSSCWLLFLSNLGISGNKSVEKSSLQDQDRQQISFFFLETVRDAILS